MNILGIDPGTRRIGYGLVARGGKPKLLATGILRIRAEHDHAALLETKAEMEAFLKQWKPDVLAIEKLFFVKNQTTGLQVAEARGVVLAACLERGLRVVEYSPSEVKAALTGDGRADKRAMAKMVRLILNEPGLAAIDDAMDALGIALVACERLRAEERLA